VPVFFYGELASADGRRERAFFRDGGLDALCGRMQSGGLEPDLGPLEPHPTAGATLVTARPPLAAFNMVLGGADIGGAREVAAELRESGGGLPGVRAIAIDLGDAGIQVSTNVHDPLSTPLVDVIAAVDRLSRHRGAWVSATEVIGLVPEAAMSGFPDALLPDGFDPDLHLIERRLH
jgi:glutamate formiminotransferase/glutamate formiminotransferase/formiminotetrahydrofolate cyclodeaminase